MKALLVLICLLFSSAAYADHTVDVKPYRSTVKAYAPILKTNARASTYGITRTYRMRGTGVVERNAYACGYTKRIMRHSRVVKFRERFLVNVVPFEDIDGDSTLPGWATIRYLHADGYSRTIIRMYANDRKAIGLYVLHSIRNDRPCTDVVRLEGERL